jgi:hypothetical protein
MPGVFIIRIIIILQKFSAFFSLPDCLNGSARQAGLPQVLKDGKENREFFVTCKGP